MLAKCSNPSCSAPFRYLQAGRLFRLESDPAHRKDKSSQVEYFWLCGHCSSTMTLRLGKDGTVAAVPILKPIRGVPPDVALLSADRKNGLLLRSISGPLPEHLGGRTRRRLKDGHHAA
jgi:hypothetical protein